MRLSRTNLQSLNPSGQVPRHLTISQMQKMLWEMKNMRMRRLSLVM